MAFGVNKSKYYKDDNEFGRKTFMVTIVIVLCIFSIILIWKCLQAASYKIDRVTWEPKFKIYCDYYHYKYGDVKYLKEDGSTSDRGMVYAVTNFKDSIQSYPGISHVTLYGEGGYGAGADTWVTHTYKVRK